MQPCIRACIFCALSPKVPWPDGKVREVVNLSAQAAAADDSAFSIGSSDSDYGVGGASESPASPPPLAGGQHPALRSTGQQPVPLAEGAVKNWPAGDSCGTGGESTAERAASGRTGFGLLLED